MTKNSVLNEILERVVSESRRIFGDKLNSVILYGSYARGDYDDESDIDIMLLIDLPADKLMKYRDKLYDLSGELLCNYSILVSIIEKDIPTFKKYEDALPFYRNIMKEGMRIA